MLPRRWFQFRMATLFIVVTVIAIGITVGPEIFAWWNTQFSFAGVPDAKSSQAATPDYDDRKFAFTGDTNRVSGKLKHIPDLPIVALSENEVTLNVLPANAPAVPAKADLEAAALDN